LCGKIIHKVVGWIIYLGILKIYKPGMSLDVLQVKIDVERCLSEVHESYKNCKFQLGINYQLPFKANENSSIRFTQIFCLQNAGQHVNRKVISLFIFPRVVNNRMKNLSQPLREWLG
jgi:hypothetical protein